MAVLFLRTLIIYFALLLFMRLLGKRQLGELELSELVVSVLAADMATIPLQDLGIPLLNALLPIAVLFALETLLSEATLRSGRLRALVFGKPCFLIRNGQIDQQEMKNSRLSIEELFEELRARSIVDPTEVAFAVLETDGTLNVIQKSECAPVTPAQMKLSVDSAVYPYLLIANGRTNSDNLRKCGKDAQWLSDECRKRGVNSAKEVYIFTYCSDGTVFFAGKEPRP